MSRSTLHHPSDVIARPTCPSSPGHDGRASGLIGRWIARSRQRRKLAELAMADDHLLRDIGLTPEDARREAAKPFWR